MTKNPFQSVNRSNPFSHRITIVSQDSEIRNPQSEIAMTNVGFLQHNHGIQRCQFFQKSKKQFSRFRQRVQSLDALWMYYVAFGVRFSQNKSFTTI
jgi:hypothetical protein